MASYYTSYETSVALREAGAPQENAERHWYVSRVRDEPRLIYAADDLPPDACRAWRLDEVIAALMPHIQAQTGDYCGTFTLSVYDDGSSEVAFRDNRSGENVGEEGSGSSPVEAAAQAWLAVLRAAREARP